jgi:hypothetical protein
VRLSTIIIGDGVVGSLWTLLIRAQFEIMEPLMIWIEAQVRHVLVLVHFAARFDVRTRYRRWRRGGIVSVVVEREVSFGMSLVFNVPFRLDGIASVYAGPNDPQIGRN